jgi:hypothetical protein
MGLVLVGTRDNSQLSKAQEVTRIYHIAARRYTKNRLESSFRERHLNLINEKLADLITRIGLGTLRYHHCDESYYWFLVDLALCPIVPGG